MNGGPSEQYRDSGNLAARGTLHARYSTIDWFAWVADRLCLPEGAHVLDVGCGPGWFWETAAARQPEKLRLVLADLSHGMAAEARRRADGTGHFAQVDALQASAASLPFADACFDAVLAMHMLYHLPNPEAAVDEMARVLRPSGHLFVTTNGANDMLAINALRARAFGGPKINPAAMRFGLERARDVLRTRFAQVELIVLRDVYAVTDPKDVFDYLVSMPPGIGASAAKKKALRQNIDVAFSAAGGVLEMERETGIVIATEA